MHAALDINLPNYATSIAGTAEIVAAISYLSLCVAFEHSGSRSVRRHRTHVRRGQVDLVEKIQTDYAGLCLCRCRHRS